jgi:mono/diheme cytochrome c family protein
MMKNAKMCGLLLGAVSGLAALSVSWNGQQGSLRYVALSPAHAQDAPEAKPAEVVAPKDMTPAQLAEAAYASLDKNCAACHGAGKRLNKMVPLDRESHAKLLEKKEVVPGKPDESPLYTRMLDKESPMPPPKSEPKPSEQEIEIIRLWIEKGAVPLPAPPVSPGK